MALNDQMMRSRFELKYVIDEVKAAQVRNFARSYLQRDEHAIPELHYAYPIYSVYVDNDGLKLYNGTVQGEKNRYKLRIRYYDFNPWSPVFFEIKRRVNEVILKDRAVVRRECLPRLLRHWGGTRSDLVNPDDMDSYDALRTFCQLARDINATGKTIVAYDREAWVTPSDDNVRLTFDRNLRGARFSGDLNPPEKMWISPPTDGVTLELKFDGRYPIWMNDLVQSCNLYRTSMAKYVYCTYWMPKMRPQLSRL